MANKLWNPNGTTPFDYDKYKQLSKDKDYRGLAELFKTSTYDSKEKWLQAQELINDFEEQADVEDHLYKNNPEAKLDYEFLNDKLYKSDGSYINKNAERFDQEWNKIFGNEETTEIKLTKEGIDKLNEITKGDLNKLGILRKENYVISFNKTNPNKVSLMSTLYNLHEAQNVPENINKGLFGLMDTPKILYFDDDVFGELYSRGVSYNDNTYDSWLKTALKYVGNFAKASNVAVNPMAELKFNEYCVPYSTIANIIKASKQSMDTVLNDINTEPQLHNMTVTNYLGENHKQLFNLFSAGAIDLKTYNALKKELSDGYDTLLMGSDLSKYEVYSFNEDSDAPNVLTYINDNIQRSEFNQIIQNALHEHRVTYSAASDGRMTGVMVTIAPKSDSDDNPSKGTLGKGYRFFIKDLWKSKAEDALNADPTFKAQTILDNRQMIGHDYTTIDGTKISNFYGEGAIITDENGQRNATNNELHKLITEDIIAKELAHSAQDYYFDDDGNLPETKELITDLINKCDEAAIRTYNDNIVEAGLFSKKLLNIILDKLNVDIEEAIN